MSVSFGKLRLRLPHIAVLQFPGPDGVRPGTLAERAGMSKQAMNQFFEQSEMLGPKLNAPCMLDVAE
jgi:hypothetical protein